MDILHLILKNNWKKIQKLLILGKKTVERIFLKNLKILFVCNKWLKTKYKIYENVL